MGVAQSPKLRLLAAALPFVFVLHVLEEAPQFVVWFNRLVTPGITQQSFLSVNAVAFLITLVLAVMVVTSTESALPVMAVAWIGLLMLANGSFISLGPLRIRVTRPALSRVRSFTSRFRSCSCVPW